MRPRHDPYIILKDSRASLFVARIWAARRPSFWGRFWEINEEKTLPRREREKREKREKREERRTIRYKTEKR